MRRLGLILATVCALSLVGWLAHAQQSCRGWQDYECTDGFASYWVATAAPPAISAGNNGAIYQDATTGDFTFISTIGPTTYGMQAQSCGTSPQTFMTDSFTNGSFTCQQVAYASVSGTPVACTDFVHLPCQGGTSDIGGTDANTTVLACEPGFFHRGWDEYFQQSPPVAPTGTKVRVWNGTTGAGIQSEDASLVNRYMAKDVACSGGTPFATGQSLGATTCGAPAVTCGQSEGPFTGVISKLAGTCATTFQNIAAHTIWANPTALSAAPVQTNIGTTLAFDGTSQLQDVGMRDGGGVNHVTAGTWGIGTLLGIDLSGQIAAGVSVPCGALPAFTGGAKSVGSTCALTLDGPSVAASATKLIFTYEFIQSAGTTTWFSPGGVGSSSGTLEYPNDFKAGTINLRANMQANGISSGTLSFVVTLDGTPVGGTGYNPTSATPAGVTAIGPLPTGSASANDTYGIRATTSAGYTTSGLVVVTFEVVLTP